MNDILILICLIILSGFFSASELAFITADKLKFEIKARQKKITALSFNYFNNKPENFFSTILISNNVVNITFASLSTIFLLQNYQLSDLEMLVISSSILLLFGEIIPKILARDFSNAFMILSIIPLKIIYYIIFPFVKLASLISNSLIKPTRLAEENKIKLYDREDFHRLLEEGKISGNVDLIESDLIKKVLDLGEQKVYEAMTTRTNIIGVEINTPIDEVRKIFIDSEYSKLPVYEESMDQVKGVILAKDMFKNPKSISEVLRDVIFVPGSIKSLDMLNQFLNKQVSIAIVLDEFGGTDGLITVEDIIEEMFGEIRDEHDTDEVKKEDIKKIDDQNFILSASAKIDDIKDEINIEIIEGDYETIGGFITSYLGRIPKEKEMVKISNLKFLILKADNKKIDNLKLTIEID
ncbi:MAG: HlyC/CorC family transporter [Ignavibacteriales bacterium]|nr:HlyC/CorC family transporter [Ignavibacteriales bacterium]